MNSNNRCKELTEEQKRELLSPPDEVIKANLRHDAKYGVCYERVQWRSAYVPASPRLDRESIWAFHRRNDEARALSMGIQIV